MILDGKKSILYLPDRNVRLSRMENTLLTVILHDKNRVVGMGEILQEIFPDYDNAPIYIKKVQNTCIRLNQKIYPYFQLKYKRNIYCYIDVAIDLRWKKLFLKEHKNTIILIKKYQELENIKHEIQKLKLKIY